MKDKVASVTRTDSQVSFGKEMTLLLAKEGCDAVAVTYINLEDAEKTTAADIANVTVFLASDVTSYVTGQIF